MRTGVRKTSSVPTRAAPAREAAAPRPKLVPARRPRSLAGAVLPPLVTLVIVLLAWQMLVMAFKVPSYLVPTPLEAVQGASDARADLGVALVATLVDALIGLALSIVMGLLVAIVITPF